MTTLDQRNPRQTDHPTPHPALTRAFNHATRYLDGLDDTPVGARLTLEQLRARLGGAVPERGTPPDRVIDDLVAATDGGHNGCAGGRFFAWVIGGALESALAADWLTSTWDQNAALYACSPSAAVAEEIAGDWLKEMLHLPAEASFAFTTGCQLAHITCLIAARHAVLQRAGWDVNDAGLCGAPRIRVITTAERHHSVDRAVRILGLGNRNLIALPADDLGRMYVAKFEQTLRAEACPTIVVLDAADLNIAAFDPFDKLIPIAHAAGVWVHIDGAFGLMARASRAKRALMPGIELADSWATDCHKWLNVPYDCGFAVVRDRAAHRDSLTIAASYIAAEGRARDEIDWNLEWSRRARGFTVYAALRELGRDGFERIIDTCCAHASAIVEGLGNLPGVEVLWKPTLNQGLVRFLDPRAGATDADHDTRTDAVIAAINAGGEAFFSGTTWRTQRAMRISVVNWRTTAKDVHRVVAAAKAAIAQVA